MATGPVFRCGGVLWEPVSRHDYDRYTAGMLVPSQRDVVWCLAPTRTPVACINSSIEMMLCLCGNFGQHARVRNLLCDPRLDRDDIHPAARADCCLFLEDRDGLAEILHASGAARAYVDGLNPSHVGPEITEWAQGLSLRVATTGATPDSATS